MSLEQPVLYTVLIGDMDPDGLEGSPLSAFQHTRLNREDMKNLVKAINEELAHGRTDAELDKVFETFWPDFDANIAKLLTMNVSSKRMIRIVDVAQDSSIIAGRVFQDVIIRGPAVLAVLEQCRFTDCTFGSPGPNEMLWRPLGKLVIGAIGVTRCDFERCFFDGVGFTGSDEVLAVLKQLRTRHSNEAEGHKP